MGADQRWPLGERWKTSRVLLPASLAPLTFQDAFTGAELKPVKSNGNAWLFVGQALGTLPVALLTTI